MRILKFGGKSLSTIKKAQNICKYIKKIYKNEKKLIIVVSAMGNTTNNLLKSCSSLKPDKYATRELDVLLSTGETASASIFAMSLNKCGVPAKSFQSWQIKIKTHGNHQNSLITSIEKSKLDKCLESDTVVVVAGFQGINSSGDITTLGRGGSDTTACALGSAYNVNVELFSDFDGIFSCDPRDMKSKKIKKVSLSQLERSSKTGSKLVSQRAVKIATEHNISLFLKSSTKPTNGGSLANNIETENILISSIQNLCEITIDFPNETKLKLISKNVLFWLKDYKLYNFTLKSYNIVLTVNVSDKAEVLKILCKKLNI